MLHSDTLEATPPGKWSATIQPAAILCVVLAIVALRCWIAGHLDFETDEPYYWLWSRGLALSYFDHPPMVAYFIRLGTMLFGDTGWGIRSMAVASVIVASGLLYILAQILFEDRRVSLLSVFWFNATPHTTFFSIIMFPDTPALLFWVATCVGLAMVWRSGRGTWWYFVGAAMGLLLLSKYTGVCLIFGTAAWLLLSPAMQPWLRRREPYLAGLITLILFTPVIVWNSEHGWASFIKQFGRALETSSDGGFANVASFVGIQAAFVSPTIFVFVIAGLAVAVWRGFRWQKANWLLLALTSVPMLLYFLLHGLSAEVLPQWPSAVYPGAIVAAVAAFSQPNASISDRPILRYGFDSAPWIGLAFTLFFFVQLTERPVPLSERHDPLDRFVGWSELSAKARAAAAGEQAGYILTDEQGMEGALAFYIRDLPVFQMSESIRYEALPPIDQAILKGTIGIYVASGPFEERDRLQTHFDSIELVSTIWRTRNGIPIEPYRVYRLKGYRGGIPF
jgi:4-amino-4-deoxy-L-arabinose transferase-like glycosyltransferase